MQKQRKLNATESDFKSFKINLSTPTYLPSLLSVKREVENTLLLLTQKERKNFEMKVLNEFLPREMKR